MSCVDVVITTIGRPSLEQAILAAMHQTYDDCRTVVIADGENEMARCMFAEMTAGTQVNGRDRLYIETPERHGAGNPVKEWWINSPRAAPFIRFLDDDDWIPPAGVAVMMGAMQPDVVLVTCLMCTLTVRPDGVQKWRMTPGTMAPDRIGGGSCLIRTEAARGIPLEHKKNGDYLFLRELVKRGRHVSVNLPLYWYNGYRCDAQRGYT